jgi:hypothetical protein
VTVLKRFIDSRLGSGWRLAVAATVAFLLVSASAIGGTAMHYGGVRAASSRLGGTNSQLVSKNTQLQDEITNANQRRQQLTAPVRAKLKHQKATTRRLSQKATTLKAQLRRVRRSAQARYQTGWNAGHKAGYNEGHSAGYDQGHTAGYDAGLADAVDVGGSGDTSSAGCDPNYTGCVPDVGYDVDCAEVDGPVEVIGDDVDGLDGDGDGVACE